MWLKWPDTFCSLTNLFLYLSTRSNAPRPWFKQNFLHPALFARSILNFYPFLLAWGNIPSTHLFLSARLTDFLFCNQFRFLHLYWDTLQQLKIEIIIPWRSEHNRHANNLWPSPYPNNASKFPVQNTSEWTITLLDNF